MPTTPSARAGSKIAVLVLSCAALLVACGGGGGSGAATATDASGYPGNPVSCSDTSQKAWLRSYMNDQYLWYDQQGTPNEAAAGPAEYLDSLLYKAKDRYSYAQSTAQFTQFFAEGTRTGYGYSWAWADSAKTVMKLILIEPLSPLGAPGGLQRGDTIVSIDGYTPAQIANGQLPVVSTEGVTRTFVVKDAAALQRTLSVQSINFALSPVIQKTILTAGSTTVGYLMYQEFISTGSVALGAAFDFFRTQGATELILDLRYNGGGSTLQARNLASMVDGKVFANYRYSAKNAASNSAQTFGSSGLPAAPLTTLNRVFVITSGNTASASELVINALKPFFKEVVTIGSTTYSAVNIEIANASGFADYSAGFAPTCAVSDDLTRQLGDPAELRTAAALSYIATGACPPVAAISDANQAKTQSNIAQSATKNVANDNHRQDLGFGELGPRQARVD
jgi:carboxyl-terminal processing protease